MTEQSFKYRSMAQSEDLMFDEVKAFLSGQGISGNVLYYIMLAISEGFTNALEHGNKYNPNKQIYIKLRVNEDSVIADIVDEGSCDIETIKSRESASETEEGGRGVDLMFHYADEIQLNKNSKTGGLHLEMTFMLSKEKSLIPGNKR